MKTTKISLRTGLMTTIVICWLVPIIIVVTLAGLLLGNSYRRSAQQEIDAGAENALRQVQMHLERAIRDSKSVSYDGVVRSAYRGYQESGDSAGLYRSVNDYLNQSFSREEQYKAVFISFWDDTIHADAYLQSSGTTSYGLLRQCRAHTPGILDVMAQADTDIRFLLLDGQLYMARNLLDSDFRPYASVVMLLDPGVIFLPLDTMNRLSNMQLCVDGTAFSLDDQGNLAAASEAVDPDMRYELEVEGHQLSFTASLTAYDFWAQDPLLFRAVAAVALMVLPLLIVMIGLFYHHITRPMETLAYANLLVQSGERGYEITQKPPNTEFGKLYSHFNAMSTELKNQFERSYLEQQATQRAQIKALQSQINPHFLNNTLEIINWEARLAENDRVSAMIEALSTMLDAALDRDGRTQIPLREELGYVDAYLYIIRERLGEGFRVHKKIDETTLEQLIPRLILQPIVENAVEHDITARHGGNLWVRAYRAEDRMVLEVEHDGTMTDADRENIRSLLYETASRGSRVGLRNVHQRLKLLYGGEGVLTIDEIRPGSILARVSFPTGRSL